MAIKYADLGITDEIRTVVSEVKSGEIHFFENVKIDPLPNPFNPDEIQDTFTHYYSAPVFSVRDEFDERVNRAGTFLDGNYQVTIALPTVELKDNLFAYLNFSDEAFIATGVLDKYSIELSTLVKCYIDTTRNVPHTWEYVKTNFETEVNSV